MNKRVYTTRTVTVAGVPVTVSVVGHEPDPAGRRQSSHSR
jgi:NADPH-dependent ferric siderophore reductase